MAKQKRNTLPDSDIHFRKCGYIVRVWRNNWAGDMFEQFYEADFDTLRSDMERLSFTFVEHTDD